MKKSMKFIAISIALLTVIVMLSSCTDTNQPTQTPNTQQTTQTPEKTAEAEKQRRTFMFSESGLRQKLPTALKRASRSVFAPAVKRKSKPEELGSHIYENEKCTVCGKDQYNKNLSFALVYDSVVVTGIGSCTDGEISIPPTYNGFPVEYIEEDAFKDCTQITSVIIPDSVKNVRSGAFSGCTNLKSVSLPNGIEYISIGVFEGCTSLTSITFPSSVTSIGVYSFKGCTSLTGIDIPSSINTISANAFENCTSLASITIPKNVEAIGAEAFKGCTSLTDIYCQSTTQPIGWFTAWKSGCSATVHWDSN